MNYELYLFYLFSGFTIISSIMLISLQNAVYSVLFLVIVFCNVISILILLNAEFLAFLLLIVYIGAIAVLFLFVVMMLNIKFVTTKLDIWFTILLSFTIICTFVFQIFVTISINFEVLDNTLQTTYFWVNWIFKNDNLNNIEIIGNVLYTKYSFIFLMSGFILLIAMVGVIVLTMHQKSNVKKQLISKQLVRDLKGNTKLISI
uniref:NADH-ubiquinone oxidoreductase chain 6 n=1 Tax=Kumanoa ambigua TaxID=644273 RepID=A0A343UXU8_9FLOR|nr:NADH dehydrogenase subunit 6 [Kumanoa ambigua]AVK39505.1 NADH dehydrogenase subunit 6 [Kumanoa ambigua]